jgi:hypothetical protein
VACINAYRLYLLHSVNIHPLIYLHFRTELYCKLFEYSSKAMLQNLRVRLGGKCWCHKAISRNYDNSQYDVDSWLIQKEESRVAHLATYTRFPHSLCDSSPSASFTTLGFCVIHCLRLIHCLRILRRSFASYSKRVFNSDFQHLSYWKKRSRSVRV